MPIPTTAVDVPNDTTPNEWSILPPAEYLDADNKKNLLMRQEPQLIPRPQTYSANSGFYNVFISPAPTTDQQVLDWARNVAFSLVDINQGPNVESAANANIRAKNNIFKPDNLVYPRANGGIPAVNNNPAYLYNNPSANALSNAGINYHE
jgi:hypothetical protein